MPRRQQLCLPLCTFVPFKVDEACRQRLHTPQIIFRVGVVFRD
jgi:hypothetical protein